MALVGVAGSFADRSHEVGGVVDFRFGPGLSFAPHVFARPHRAHRVAHQGHARFVTEVHVAGESRGDDLLLEEQRFGQAPAEAFPAVQGDIAIAGLHQGQQFRAPHGAFDEMDALILPCLAPDFRPLFTFGFRMADFEDQADLRGRLLGKCLAERADQACGVLAFGAGAEVEGKVEEESFFRQAEVAARLRADGTEFHRQAHGQNRAWRGEAVGVGGEFADPPDLIHAGVGVAAVLRPVGQFPWPEADVVASAERGEPTLADVACGLDPGEAEEVDPVARLIAHPTFRAVLGLRDVFARGKVEDTNRNILRLEREGHLPDVFADAQFTPGEADEIYAEGAVHDVWCPRRRVDSGHQLS